MSTLVFLSNVINYAFKTVLTALSPKACHFFLMFYILGSNVNIVSYIIPNALGVTLASSSLNLTSTELLNWKTCLHSHNLYILSLSIVTTLVQLLFFLPLPTVLSFHKCRSILLHSIIVILTK